MTTTTTENVFEYAARQKLRFASSKGLITVEDLWDVPLRSKDEFNLNAIAQAASKAWKALTEESFVDRTAKTPEHERREMAFKIVEYVIETKLAEEEEAKRRANNEIEKGRLIKILADQQDRELSELSKDEIKKRIADLSK